MIKSRQRLQFKEKPTSVRTWIDLSWIFLLIALLGVIGLELGTGRLCNQMGVDFRGYYASGQIALRYGFDAVYNQELQKEFQSALLFHCPTPPKEPPLYVAMPYLPFYVVFFLPFTLIEFSTSYLVWVILQMSVFLVYLVCFTRAFKSRTSIFRILQWGICIPLVANLYLGQINAFLVVFFCEFVLLAARRKNRIGGLLLSAILLKPHLLILLIPGLVLSQNWQVLLGFVAGSAAILGSSFLLAGSQGLTAMLQLTYQFAGSLITTAHGMMNWRALALNLVPYIPATAAWLISTLGMIGIAWLVLRCWLRSHPNSSEEWVRLLFLTLTGTFIVSWHSHFYMLILLVPFLVYLDARQALTPQWLAAWLLGPALLYLASHLLNPVYDRSLFGLGMLALNILMFFHALPWFSSRALLHTRPTLDRPDGWIEQRPE